MNAKSPNMFEPIRIGSVTFKNRLMRSSIGGRSAYYDGTVNDAWETFERRFASGGVGGIISATLTVDHDRWSPLEYPAISHDEFVKPLAQKIERLRKDFGCAYIIQIGDPGYHTQTSLFRQNADALTATSGIDPLYGYMSLRKPMRVDQIRRVIENFAKAARRVRCTGADGIEVTASKGYLIHQFLNPGTNRRRDEYGGPLEDRFRLLKEIVQAVRDDVGRDFLFGVRLSSRDFNRHPWLALLRFGPGPWPSALTGGNGLKDMLRVGGWLKELGVDYLHISSGFGFINAKENPGRFPTPEVRMFTNSTRHLTLRAAARAILLNTILRDPLMNIGWSRPHGDGRNMLTNLDDARVFKQTLNMPIIVNGGFQYRAHIEEAIGGPDGCDMVSMARSLLANPGLPRAMKKGRLSGPPRPCTFCNRCAVRTTLFPLGCYEPERFNTDRRGRLRNNEETYEAMQNQILSLNRPRRQPC
jgi:2,4-dienoyl-CoA reductase (NADPH2)